ncbi:baseplate J/gp47 family protein [Providencia rettgeri]
MSSATPSATITDTGLLIPTDDEILRGRLADMVSVMPAGASSSLSSPQGQLAVSDTAIISNVYSSLNEIINGINPDFASGRFQDAIGRIYFLERKAATATVVTALCTGRKGAVIPSGAMAITDDKTIYKTINDFVIPNSGQIDVEFYCTETGGNQCAIGELNTIYTAVSGWDSIYNNYAGVIGSEEESRFSFEVRRRESVARNSRNQDGSIRAAILDLDSVVDCYVWSNRTSSSIVKDGYSILPHSLYCCVYGGKDEDIANAIFENLTLGCNLNGDKVVTVYDETYDHPRPEYEMTWLEAKPLNVYFQVKINQSVEPPSNITELVKRRIIEVFNGRYESINRARIGGLILSSRYYEPIIAIQPDSVIVDDLKISMDGVTFSSNITIPITMMPVIDEANIEVNLV